MKKYYLIQSAFLSVTMILFYSCQYNDFSNGNGKSTSAEVLVKVGVKIAVGGILYENLDARLVVKGYSANNSVLWVKDFDVTGPYDTLSIHSGFDHYSIELVDKWGVNDTQSEISSNDIWGGRADGPLPITYVLGGSISAKKISSYITYKEVSGGITEIVYQPESRVLYAYRSDGLLESIKHQVFNSQTSQFEDFRTDSFVHDGNKVSKIITNLNGQPYSEDHFEYGTENKATETLHFDNDLVWTQKSKYNYDSSNVSVDYNLSNGNSFSYAYNVLYKNIINDNTTQASQLCNQGNYTYDKNINPFRHLGYADFYLQNISINNKVSEDVNYYACGFPAIIPLLHSYTYDQSGYPVSEIINFKSYNSQSSKTFHEKKEFFYQE